MSNTRVIKLSLGSVRLEAIEGCGSELVVKLVAFRTTKAGTPERYELQLGTCRYAVRTLLDQLKQMHARDKERINRELARISQEQNALRVES